MSDIQDATKDDHPAEGSSARAWYRAAVGTAAVAGLFSLIVLVLMLAHHSRVEDLKDSAEMKTMKRALYEQPKNDELRNRIRAFDVEIRKRYFAPRELNAQGAYLLLGGLVVFFVAIKSAVTLRKRLPMPRATSGQRGERARAARMASWSVAVLGLIVAAAAVVLATTSMSGLTRASLEPREGEAPKPVAKGPPPPSEEEIRKNWPRFRGPTGNGVSHYTNVPTAWNGKTGEGILWKAEVPLPAPSSPVVWGNRVFLTGCTKTRGEVYCLDADTGRLVWRRPVTDVPGSPAKPPEVMPSVGLAASTPVADGQRVCAIFANGDLVCFDFQGKRLWARNLGPPENSYGHASSLVMWRDRLLVLYDQAAPDDKKSKLIALDAGSGRTLWSARRETPQTWTTPMVIKAAKRDQIVVCGDPWVAAYDPATGVELWKADILGGEIAPSPTYAAGLVFVANSHGYAAAIRPDGKGDVTKTHVVWTGEDGLPDICSPVSSGELVFLVASGGLVTCYDAKKGNVVWEKELDKHCSASPVLVGDRVYLQGEKGLMVIFHAGREYKELGRAELGEKVRATPAFLDGRMYIRGEKHLFCIGKK